MRDEHHAREHHVSVAGIGVEGLQVSFHGGGAQLAVAFTSSPTPSSTAPCWRRGVCSACSSTRCSSGLRACHGCTKWRRREHRGGKQRRRELLHHLVQGRFQGREVVGGGGPAGTAASLRELPSKTSPKTGFVPYAALARTTSRCTRNSAALLFSHWPHDASWRPDEQCATMMPRIGTAHPRPAQLETDS